MAQATFDPDLPDYMQGFAESCYDMNTKEELEQYQIRLRHVQTDMDIIEKETGTRPSIKDLIKCMESVVETMREHDKQ